MTGYLIDDKSYVYKDFEARRKQADNLFNQIRTAALESPDLGRFVVYARVQCKSIANDIM